jgi:hypothetical protein
MGGGGGLVKEKAPDLWGRQVSGASWASGEIWGLPCSWPWRGSRWTSEPLRSA